MNLPVFKLEDYLSVREFGAPYMLCGSDAESHSMSDIVNMADEECLEMWNSLGLSYTEARGHPLMLKEISRLYDGLKKDDVLSFAGAEEGIYCMSHALLEKDDHAIIIVPCYQSLEAVPSTICSTTKIQLRYENDWIVDIDEIRRSIRPNTKMLIINFPHNPTGSVPSREKQQKLIDLAREHDLWIFSDEVYRLLEIDENDRLPTIASRYEKGLSLGVMSKAYGLAGLRIGWIACQNKEAIDKIGHIKHYLSICNSAPSEYLTIIALRASEQILSRNRSIVSKNIALLDEFFVRNSEMFEWKRPKGGCVGLVLNKSKTPVDDMADELLQKKGVVILPGRIFDYPGNYFRIGFGRKNMPEALKHMEDCIGL